MGKIWGTIVCMSLALVAAHQPPSTATTNKLARPVTGHKGKESFAITRKSLSMPPQVEAREGRPASVVSMGVRSARARDRSRGKSAASTLRGGSFHLGQPPLIPPLMEFREGHTPKEEQERRERLAKNHDPVSAPPRGPDPTALKELQVELGTDSLDETVDEERIPRPHAVSKGASAKKRGWVP